MPEMQFIRAYRIFDESGQSAGHFVERALDDLSKRAKGGSVAIVSIRSLGIRPTNVLRDLSPPNFLAIN
jgi:hypothetical protein